ncbi:response regulator [candidate division WWE3 bacterium]|nr:response regulator [candidate division WWE3 bacterium]
MKKILILEKDKDHREHLKRMLENEGYEIIQAKKSMSAFNKLDKQKVDLIISDYYLPTIRGEKFYEEISTVFENTPIIFLSNRADSKTIAKILQHPNADYMVKPVVMEELIARIKAFIDADLKDNPSLKTGGLILNTKNYRVLRNDREIDLSPTEFKLLKYLMQNKGVVLTRRMILNKVWGYSYDVSSRIVDVYIGYLREKIDKGEKQKLIETIPGFGYKIFNSKD